MSGKFGTVLQDEPGSLELGGKEQEPLYSMEQEEGQEGRQSHQVVSDADETTILDTCSRFTGFVCGL